MVVAWDGKFELLEVQGGTSSFEIQYQMNVTFRRVFSQYSSIWLRSLPRSEIWTSFSATLSIMVEFIQAFLRRSEDKLPAFW